MNWVKGCEPKNLIVRASSQLDIRLSAVGKSYGLYCTLPNIYSTFIRTVPLLRATTFKSYTLLMVFGRCRASGPLSLQSQVVPYSADSKQGFIWFVQTAENNLNLIMLIFFSSCTLFSCAVQLCCSVALFSCTAQLHCSVALLWCISAASTSNATAEQW